MPWFIFLLLGCFQIITTSTVLGMKGNQFPQLATRLSLGMKGNQFPELANRLSFDQQAVTKLLKPIEQLHRTGRFEEGLKLVLSRMGEISGQSLKSGIKPAIKTKLAIELSYIWLYYGDFHRLLNHAKEAMTGLRIGTTRFQELGLPYKAYFDAAGAKAEMLPLRKPTPFQLSKLKQPFLDSPKYQWLDDLLTTMTPEQALQYISSSKLLRTKLNALDPATILWRSQAQESVAGATTTRVSRTIRRLRSPSSTTNQLHTKMRAFARLYFLKLTPQKQKKYRILTQDDPIFQ